MPQQIITENPGNKTPGKKSPGTKNPGTPGKNSGIGAAGSVPSPLTALFTTATSHRENIVTLTTFVVSIFILTAVSLFRTDENAALLENRVAAPFPKFAFHRKELHDFPQAFEAWFSDRFAFKSKLVGARNYFLLKALSTSGTPSVILGKNNFLFWAEEDETTLIRHDAPFTEKQLNAWKNVLETRSKWCGDNGMDYYYVIAPSKATIYRENLPDYYPLSNPKSRREQLLEYLKNTKANVKVFDLTPALMESKKGGVRYYLTDSHWNQLGAHAACVQLVNKIIERHPSVGKPISDADLFVAPVEIKNGDLARMLGLMGWINEPNLQLGWKSPAKYKWNFYGKDYTNFYKTEDTAPRAAITNGSTQPTAIMFHDSFTCFLRMYLSCNFSKIGYFWQPNFDRALLLKEHPKIVLQEQIENKLYKEVPAP